MTARTTDAPTGGLPRSELGSVVYLGYVAPVLRAAARPWRRPALAVRRRLTRVVRWVATSLDRTLSGSTSTRVWDGGRR